MPDAISYDEIVYIWTNKVGKSTGRKEGRMVTDFSAILTSRQVSEDESLFELRCGWWANIASF